MEGKEAKLGLGISCMSLLQLGKSNGTCQGRQVAQQSSGGGAARPACTLLGRAVVMMCTHSCHDMQAQLS
eukprot:1143137-Pelagomonas_calceolata.AAC.4